MIGCQCTVTVRPGSEIDGRFGLWGRPAADDCRIGESVRVASGPGLEGPVTECDSVLA